MGVSFPSSDNGFNFRCSSKIKTTQGSYKICYNLQDPLLFQHDIKGNISIVLSKLSANEFYVNIAFINRFFKLVETDKVNPLANNTILLKGIISLLATLTTPFSFFEFVLHFALLYHLLKISLFPLRYCVDIQR